MYELYPYFTNDGSVGLFSPKDDDIYHSTYGALTEAYEKFILPANFDDYLKKNNEIKILDICFGIGYNSKSFLNYFFENFEKKLLDLNTTIDTIDANNKFNKIFIKAIDMDKNLIYLSPFIETNKKIICNNKIDFKHEKISRLLQKRTSSKFKYNKFINIILLKKLVKTCPEIFEDKEFNQILKSRKYERYFDKNMCSIYQFYRNQGYCNNPLTHLKVFLHNIYYNHISRSYKKALRYLKLNDFNFEVNFNDARQAIIDDKNVYNYIFLDAFTPAKCPCLWTVDFFKLLHKHLDNNGMILTYSNSASVRNAFIQAGFWTGKIYNKENDKFMGTIATKNLELIKHGLSEYDLGLINTKAGIVYRDEDLNADNGAILLAHASEVAASCLQSSSKFIKTFRGNK